MSNKTFLRLTRMHLFFSAATQAILDRLGFVYGIDGLDINFRGTHEGLELADVTPVPSTGLIVERPTINFATLENSRNRVSSDFDIYIGGKRFHGVIERRRDDESGRIAVEIIHCIETFDIGYGDKLKKITRSFPSRISREDRMVWMNFSPGHILQVVDAVDARHFYFDVPGWSYKLPRSFLTPDFLEWTPA